MPGISPQSQKFPGSVEFSKTKQTVKIAEPKLLSLEVGFEGCTEKGKCQLDLTQLGREDAQIMVGIRMQRTVLENPAIECFSLVQLPCLMVYQCLLKGLINFRIIGDMLIF